MGASKIEPFECSSWASLPGRKQLPQSVLVPLLVPEIETSKRKPNRRLYVLSTGAVTGQVLKQFSLFESVVALPRQSNTATGLFGELPKLAV